MVIGKKCLTEENAERPSIPMKGLPCVLRALGGDAFRLHLGSQPAEVDGPGRPFRRAYRSAGKGLSAPVYHDPRDHGPEFSWGHRQNVM
jgi:hypothetical protein